MAEPHTFETLARTAQQISETRSSNRKIRLCAHYFAQIDSDKDLDRAAQFLGEGAFSRISGKRASVGSRTISTCAARFCEIDYERVFKPCKTATGSASEAIEKLIRNIPKARKKRTPQSLSLETIESIYEDLYRVSSKDDKQAILAEAWKKMTPAEIKYFIRILRQGSLRIGFETKSVVAALAKAFDQPIDEVRYTHMITGSIGRTAVLSRKGALDEASFQMFQPLSFMLASPIESRTIDDLEPYVAEEKFDGMRAQVHIGNQKVKIFSRDLNDVTHTFPEISTFFLSKNIPDMVLDGEICVFIDNTIRPFQFLQKRMGVKKPGKKILERYPVLFVAYDLIYHDDQPCFELPLIKRRNQLEQVASQFNLPITSQFNIESREDIDKHFEMALKHGNEGLVLKRSDSAYEYGQRRKSWLKVKKPGGTLDTVIMYAHAGSGKRGGYYSDFTLGISVREDERYEEEFIPIGKAYGGYTDDELVLMNEKISELAVDRYGPTLALRPGLMVEIEFDDIQVNKRTKANYTLRLPRFKAIRWDLSPDDADTLKDVERLYQKKLNDERLPQHENPSFLYPR